MQTKVSIEDQAASTTLRGLFLPYVIGECMHGLLWYQRLSVSRPTQKMNPTEESLQYAVKQILNTIKTATTIQHSITSHNIYLGYCMLKFYMQNSVIYVNQ